MAVFGAAALSATGGTGAERLTAAGAALEPVSYAEGAALEVAVDAAGDEVLSAHVILRPHSTNLLLARDRDGFWTPWSGDPGALPEAAVRREGDRLVFKLFAAPPESLTPPFVLTLAYRTPEGFRHGAFTASPEVGE